MTGWRPHGGTVQNVRAVGYGASIDQVALACGKHCET